MSPSMKGAWNVHEKSDRLFTLCVGVACALHVLAMAAWAWWPHEKVEEVQVRMLNVRFAESEPAPPPVAAPVELKEKPKGRQEALKDLFGGAAPTPVAASTVHADLEDSSAKIVAKLDDAFRKYEVSDAPEADSVNAPAKKLVRQKTDSAKSAALAGSSMGNSTASNAEPLERYTQLLSAWMERFKTFPPQARASGVKGSGWVRLRIGKDGTIHQSFVDTSTGSQVLDRAMLDMAYRANPVPPLPDSITLIAGVREFRIRVSFE